MAVGIQSPGPWIKAVSHWVENFEEGKRRAATLKEYSDDIYEQLLNEGISVVLDDRKETPGVKFSDADLLGFPIRITTSERLIEENMIELKLRNSQKSIKIEKNNIINYIKKK